MTEAITPDLIRLVYLVSGQVIVGSVRLLDDGTLIVRNPREVLATPGFHDGSNMPNGKMEISLIPYGHIAGYQIAQADFLTMQREHYFTMLAPIDKELESKFRNSISSI